MLLASLIPTSIFAAEAAPDEGETASLTVARWRDGSVDQAMLESWLRYQRKTDLSATERADQVRAMVYTLALAKAASARGAEAEPAIAFSLDSLETQVLTNALHRHVLGQVVVTDAEVAAQMRAQPELRLKPRKLRLRNLFKRVPEGATEADWVAAREHMAVIRDELVGGAGFPAMASRESDSQTRFQGGLIGNLDPNELPPAIAEVVSGLEAGATSPVIETEEGLMIFRCDQVIAEVRRTPEEVRSAVVSHFRRQHGRRDWAAFQDTLLTEARPKFERGVARDPKADGDALVVRSTVGTLTREGLERLNALRPVKQALEDLSDEVIRDILEKWVTQNAAAQRARALGLHKEARVLEAIDWKRRTLLRDAELVFQVQRRFEPLTETEIKAYFEDHREDFRHPERFRVRVIAIPMIEGEERAQYRSAELLRNDLADGVVTFAESARTHSKHASAPDGGLLDWLNSRQLTGFGPQPHKVIKGLKPGELGPLVQQDQTLYILQLEGHEPSQLMAWTDAAEKAETALGNKRLAVIQADVESRLMADLDIRLAPVQ